MLFREVTAVSEAVLPVAEFRDHLRLGTGFSDTGAEDAALVAYLRAALAAIEGRTAKALIARDFTLDLSRWQSREAQPLPVAPVSAVSEIRLTDAEGEVTVLDPARYRLIPDGARPRIRALGGRFPVPGSGGSIGIDLTAGFGAAWSDLPPDLAQAVFLLAAQYYELRHDGAGEASAMPFGVMALIERWRTVRVLGGRG